ncbi:putative methyltransferase NSUN7 [Lagopus muta]|uniref:putative methyltransferase NSUN7 n=1 Tax=Lagopus muta TaxID=64668 RepID=UPI00209E82F0|nr:putative methyltransferase NSUN7 [Lagopus muta]XP_048797282.1 putative methyltransferase NSUN7 [Lagopus muta]XP_048797283.1 putative methyltransferase NSUN7 [Lagopus muta]XP_048797284.1 putative methyltransferase NSUN7 [Lagopus muta]
MTLIKKNVCHDSVYINAAKIFHSIHNKKPKDRMLVQYGDDSVSPMLTLKDEYSQRLSYELAFSALKYQDLLEEILLDSHAYPCHSIPDELTSLLLVMLYDLQDREFEARVISDEEEPIAEVQEIENFLFRFRIKLAAALARCRIKHDALSIEHFLPETIRKHEQRASALPLCAWINTLKTSLQDVFRDLKSKGFTEVESVSDLSGYTYCLDQHCHNVLFFPSSLKDELLNLDLFADCKLLLQDKSRSLAVHSVQALLSTDDDVIVAHLGSHLTVAHMSALRNHSTSTVFVCGVKTSAKAAELGDLFSHMGCKNIQLLHEDFTEIELKDPRLQNAKVILLIPQCSGLSFSNPIDFILTEHGDAGLLKDLYQGSVSKDKLCILAERQLNELMHAMKFQVQSIVYCTSSVYPEENEQVVQKALEFCVKGKKLKPFRLIPPVLPACSNPESSTDSFFKIEPSEISSGCFLAVIARETDSSKNVSAKDILSQAAAKGLLLDSILGKSKEEEKQGKEAQHGSDATRTRIEPKTAAVPHPEAVSNRKAAVVVSKVESKRKKKNSDQPRGHIQLKKPTINPASDTGVSKVPKHTSAVKVHRKQTQARKPRAECKKMVKPRAECKKMVAVKLVEIVFPPMISPYGHPQGNQHRMPAHISLLQSRQRNRSLRDREPPQPVSKVVKPTVLRNSQSGL